MTALPETFSVGGVIAGLRDTMVGELRHPALVLVVDVGGEYARIVVPPAVWPVTRDLLAIGQRVGVDGRTDSCPFVVGSRQIATEVRLVVSYH